MKKKQPKDWREYYIESYWANKDNSQLNNSSKQYIKLLLNEIILLMNSNSIFLEVGCGMGNFIHKVKSNGHKAFGIDLSEFALRQATRNASVALASADHLPIKTNSIDLVFSHHAIEHFVDPKLFLLEAKRVLKFGGRLIIVSAPVLPFGNIQMWRNFGLIREKSHISVKTRKQWIKLFKSFGYLFEKDLGHIVKLDPPNFFGLSKISKTKFIPINIIQIISGFLRIGCILRNGKT